MGRSATASGRLSSAAGSRRGRGAAWAVGAVLAVALTAACGDGGSSTSGGPPPPSTTESTSAPTTVGPTTTRLKTTVPKTTAPAPTVPATTVPAPTVPATTVPAVRSVALGETFSVVVGESVSVAGTGLSVTFARVVSDGRCRPGQQCLVAGNAVITVTAKRPGTAPATLTLETDGPSTARVGDRSIELVLLGYGQAPSARFKVT